MLHKSPVLAVEIHHPDLLHLGQLSSGQGMGTNASAKIEVLPMGYLPLHPQGVSDVVPAA